MREIISNPLNNIDYFTEWGGKSWEKLIAFSIKNFLGSNLNDKQILEIGSRYGKMSCLFALIGGKVIGVDINIDNITIANNEAAKWGIKNIKFIYYDGNLDIFQNGSFDIIFTKSVLVLIPNLQETLLKISAKLKPSGKIVFIENAYGNPIIHALRYVKHRKWNFKRATFFSKKEISMINEIFDVKFIKEIKIPPIYLLCGYKK
jgi:SAM-dependent methyltransferase